ncbi:hypothetical protein V6N13_141984 [Hibiscus sabdariffa]
MLVNDDSINGLEAQPSGLDGTASSQHNLAHEQTTPHATTSGNKNSTTGSRNELLDKKPDKVVDSFLLWTPQETLQANAMWGTQCSLLLQLHCIGFYGRNDNWRGGRRPG